LAYQSGPCGRAAPGSYQVQRWTRPRRVVAKVEWHPAELYPRVGFIVTNLARRAERIFAFYNHRHYERSRIATHIARHRRTG
jgi:Transposase DDE domain group 1